jgi:phage tail sheath protein FI
MTFQVSPGVQVKEIDLTNVVPAVSTSIGGFAGAFNWGPVEEVTTVGSEKELATIFGTPDTNTASYFLTAASFLQYGNALKVVRVGTGNKNATATGAGILVKNQDAYDSIGANLASEAFVAKYPGILGNSLLVSICPAQDLNANKPDGNPNPYYTGPTDIFAAWAYKSSFDTAPGTSDYALSKGCHNDEVHIAIIDEDGLITGTKGSVLETFAYASQASDAKSSDGTSAYYANVINTSRWVRWGSHYAILTHAGVNSVTHAADATLDAAGDYLDDVTGVVISDSLSGGSDDNAPTTGEITTGIALLGDAETVDVNLLFGITEGSDIGVAQALLATATARKDCVAFVSPDITDTVGSTTPAVDVVGFADKLTSTSYGVIDSTALKVYDKYNDVYRWIPACGHIAGLCANTDNVADAWFSPAGFTRGQLLGVTKLAFNPSQADRDTLYKARVNPIAAFPGQGIVLYGDKTAQAKPSAFDRINVRRLFIVLEKAISTAAKYQLFEFNDEFTRAMFRNMVEPFLRDIKGRRGITDFAVVCDATNNTGAIIDSNQFVADIYIKPARSINFITLNFIATRTGVEFSEIVGQ